MEPTSGISRPKTSSRSFETGAPTAFPVLILLMSGALLGASRIGSHLHLHLPGHQGLITVAAFMAAASLSRLPWSATIVGAGASAGAAIQLVQGLSFTAPLAYLLCGLTIDIAFRAAPQWRNNLLFLGLVGAAANATKPLALWSIAAASGTAFESLEHGLAYPLVSHLAFGFGGGIAAAIVALLWSHRR